MHHPLAEARVLVGARVVARGVEREARRSGRCPSCAGACRGPRPRARRRCRSSGRSGTPTRRRRSRCSAARWRAQNAGRRSWSPSQSRMAGAVERQVGSATLARAAARKLSAGPRAPASASASVKRPGVRRDERLALVGDGLDEVAAVDRRQREVGALRRIRTRAARQLQKQERVDAGAGDRRRRWWPRGGRTRARRA